MMAETGALLVTVWAGSNIFIAGGQASTGGWELRDQNGNFIKWGFLKKQSVLSQRPGAV